jgi:hypothetical protein
MCLSLNQSLWLVGLGDSDSSWPDLGHVLTVILVKAPPKPHWSESGAGREKWRVDRQNQHIYKLDPFKIVDIQMHVA